MFRGEFEITDDEKVLRPGRRQVRHLVEKMHVQPVDLSQQAIETIVGEQLTKAALRDLAFIAGRVRAHLDVPAPVSVAAVINRMKAVKRQLVKLRGTLKSGPLATAMLRQLRLARFQHDASEAGVEPQLEKGVGTSVALEDLQAQHSDSDHIREVDFDDFDFADGRTDPDEFVRGLSDMEAYIDAQVASYAGWLKINGGSKRSKREAQRPHSMDAFGRDNHDLWDDMVRQLYPWFERHVQKKPPYTYPDVASPFRRLVSEIEVIAGFKWAKEGRTDQTQIDAISHALKGGAAWGTDQTQIDAISDALKGGAPLGSGISSPNNSQ